MKRLITKKMRDSFNVSFGCRVNYYMNDQDGFRWKSTYNHFESTEKKRILILKGTIK